MDKSLFEISDLEWEYKEFRGLDSSQRIRTNISTMSVQCTSCNSKWRAVEGYQPGMFRSFLGGVQLTCPNCKVSGQVAQNILNKI